MSTATLTRPAPATFQPALRPALRSAGARPAPGAVAALSLAAFAYLTTEQLPLGLLTTMSADLGRSPSRIGLLVGGYALVVAAASVPLTRLTARLPRRRVLVGTLVVLVLATLVSAVAGSFGTLLAARVVSGLAHALFWSVVIPAGVALAPAADRGKVIAKLLIGPSLAPVVGLPAATWIGQQAGWRTAFLLLAAIDVVACVAVARLMPEQAPGPAAARTGGDARRAYTALLLVTGLYATGTMTALTYVTPLLSQAGLGASALGLAILLWGLSGVAGSVLARRVLELDPRTATLAPLGLVVAGLTVLCLAPGRAALVGLVALGVGSALVAGALQSRMLQVAPGSLEVAAAGTSAVINAGTAAGALLGGALLPLLGARGAALAGALLVAAALVTAGVGLRSGRTVRRLAG